MPPTLDGGGNGRGRSVGRSTAAIRTYIARRRREESRGAASVASRMRRAEEGREAGRRGGERERARDDRRRSCCRCDEQGSINEVEERSGAGRSGSERASEGARERTRMAKEILDTHTSERKATRARLQAEERSGLKRAKAREAAWHRCGHYMQGGHLFAEAGRDWVKRCIRA